MAEESFRLNRGVCGMTLTRVRLQRFTAFDDLDLKLSPGVNALVGANGTGKTHLMKVCYAACDVSKSNVPSDRLPSMLFHDKLIEIFLPSERSFSRMIRWPAEGINSSMEVSRKNLTLDIASRINSLGDFTHISYSGSRANFNAWSDSPIESTYIPVKEMLANAPGFRSLYAQREIHFEEVYKDILDRAYLPPLRKHDSSAKRMLERLQRAMDGKVSVKNEEFFLSGAQGDIEFTLLAEGLRKLGLLWLLIRNGSLRKGSVLFWDEPEANLNPKMYGVLMETLLELQRNGVQIFFATHDYVILKELDLRMKDSDKVAFHSLHRDGETGEIACNTARNYLGISPNAIAEAGRDIYDREIERSLGSFGR